MIAGQEAFLPVAAVEGLEGLGQLGGIFIAISRDVAQVHDHVGPHAGDPGLDGQPVVAERADDGAEVAVGNQNDSHPLRLPASGRDRPRGPHCSTCLLPGDDLAGIHQALGVESLLDPAFQVQFHRRVIAGDLVDLQAAQAVLGRDRAAELMGQVVDDFRKLLRAGMKAAGSTPPAG
nr:hypothetical protein [Oleomonas cavernae]